MKEVEYRLLNIYLESRRLGRSAAVLYHQMSAKEQGLLISEVDCFIKAGNVLPPELKFLQDTAAYRRLVGPPKKRKVRSRSKKPRGKRSEEDAINRKLKAITSCWRPANIYARPGTIELINCLDDQDKELARLWAQGCEEQVYYENFLAKMYSARLAEKAVMQFYQRAGHHVRDTSIQQVGNGEEWITHDLMVDDHIPIDVKNARTSVNSGAHYSECIVPRQKQLAREDREDSTLIDVQIAGVMSPYIAARDFEFPKQSYDPDLTILGTTSRSEIDHLSEQFSSERLDLHIMPQANSQWESVTYRYVYPPWLFSYPEHLYKNFRGGLGRLDQIEPEEVPTIDELRRIKKQPPFHVYLAAGRSVPEQWQGTLSAWQLEFYRTVQHQERAFRLPTLFLNILNHFTKQLHDPCNDFHPNGYRALIFSDSTGGMKPNGAYPLGIYDPLYLIHQLITNLATIWKVRKEYQLDRIQQFQFKGLGILRGRLPGDDHWTTILAFCGGTLPAKNHAKCGKPDLILGAEGVEVCPECHRLICPVPGCRYCWKDCEEYKQRYTKIVQQDGGTLKSQINDITWMGDTRFYDETEILF